MSVDAIANVVVAVLFWGFLATMACSLLWSEFVGMGRMFVDLGRLIVELASDVWTMLLREQQTPRLYRGAMIADDAFPLARRSPYLSVDPNRSVPALSDEAHTLMANMALFARAGKITLSAPSQDVTDYTPIYQIGTPGVYAYLDEDGRLFDPRTTHYYPTSKIPPMEYVACVKDVGITANRPDSERFFGGEFWIYEEVILAMEEGKIACSNQ